MNSFLKYLSKYYHIGKDAQEALADLITSTQLEKDSYLLEAGQICHRLYFLESGAVRGFHYENGREVTNWFGFESDLVTSFQSFINQRSGHEYIQAVEDSRIWSISRDDLYRLYDRFPKIERLGRITCEQYYIRLEDRYVNAHFKTAAERYHDLLDAYPYIIQRVPLGYVASFLGISQETLSRIRSKVIS